MLYSIGIDPGKQGAVAMIDSNFQLVTWEDCPVVGKGKKEFAVASMASVIAEFIDIPSSTELASVRAYLELARPMPKQGLSSTFTTGRGWGLWEGILAGAGISYEIVTPTVWQKVMFRGTPLGDPKTRSMLRSQRLFPNLPLKKPKGRVLSMDGRSDAALIAYWGMLQLTNQRDPAVPPKKPVRKKRK